MTVNKITSIQIPSELWAKIKQEGKQNQRNVSAQIRWVLEQYYSSSN